MSLEKNHRRAVFSWLYVFALFVLCGILGVLQYHLIGQVRDAARDRLRGSLQANLMRVSQEVDSEIAVAIAAIAPPNPVSDTAAAEQQVRARYEQWKQTARHVQMFSHVALAVPQGAELELHSIEPPQSAANGEWPASLLPLRHRLESNLRPWPRPGQGGPSSGPPPDMGMRRDNEGLAMEFPLFPATSPAPFGRHELAWVIFELNPEYVRDTLLPEILQRHLGTGGNLDYQV